MSRGETLSIMGLYAFDPTVFDNMVLPAPVDRDVLINNLVMELAELEVIYPSADLMKTAIGYWSKARIRSWDRIALVLFKDYDPFINISRDEVRTVEETRDLEGTNKGTNATKVNAWNDGNVNRNTEEGDFKTTESGNIITKDTLHIEGDSAIRDAQDVAREEIKLRAEYDVYKYIINDFKQRFCLMVY